MLRTLAAGASSPSALHAHACIRRTHLAGVSVKMLQDARGRGGDVRAGNERHVISALHAGDAQLARGGSLLEEVFEHVLCAQPVTMGSLAKGDVGRHSGQQDDRLHKQGPQCMALLHGTSCRPCRLLCRDRVLPWKMAGWSCTVGVPKASKICAGNQGHKVNRVRFNLSLWHTPKFK